ncbi:MAG: hypothetical protein WC553_01595 [Patescibacteria group bacterium]
MFDYDEAGGIARRAAVAVMRATSEPVGVRGVKIGRCIALCPEPMPDGDNCRIVRTGRDEYTGTTPPGRDEDFNECNQLMSTGDVGVVLTYTVGRRFALEARCTHGVSISEDTWMGLEVEAIQQEDYPELRNTGPVRVAQASRSVLPKRMFWLEHSLFGEYREELRTQADVRRAELRRSVYAQLKGLGTLYDVQTNVADRITRNRLIGGCMGRYDLGPTKEALGVLEAMIENLYLRHERLERLLKSGFFSEERYQLECQLWDERCEIIDQFLSGVLALDWSHCNSDEDVLKELILKESDKARFSGYATVPIEETILRFVRHWSPKMGLELLEKMQRVNATFGAVA